MASNPLAIIINANKAPSLHPSPSMGEGKVGVSPA
jgi:hypothetical protein